MVRASFSSKRIVDLSINDRFVRVTFQQCGIDDAKLRDDIRYIATETLYLVSLTDNSVEVRKDHDRWSELLANRGLFIRHGESAEMCRAALKRTFRCGSRIVIFIFCCVIAHFVLRDVSTIPFWAPMYLSRALALDFKGRDLEALVEFWECCLNCFTDHPFQEEAKNHSSFRTNLDAFALGVKNILSSGNSLSDFLSPAHLATRGFAQYLAE